jgi:putative salt-induced outer membrane protein YdiY
VFRLVLAALLLIPSLAAADRVTVKGTVLEGKVKSISPKQIVMETVYGKGDLVIATADVSAIETDEPFHIFESDDTQQVGRVVGITPAAVSLAREDGSTSEIPFDRVQAAPRDAGADANWFARRPVESPWWSGNVDLGFSSTQSTVKTTSLGTGFAMARERGPSRLRFGASYVVGNTYDTQVRNDPLTPKDESKEDTTANELRVFARQEYDLTERFFLLGSLEAEHDGVEEIAKRLIPKAGVGYKLVNTETWLLSADAGFAYVYEDFYGAGHNSYEALALGAESTWKLPWLGASWHTRLDYLPALTAWTDDYRLRGETALLVPIVEQIALKASVIDDYNAQPADDNRSNSLTTLLGLSLVY